MTIQLSYKQLLTASFLAGSMMYSITAIAELTTNKDKAVAVLNAIESGDYAAMQYINPDKYIQHNPHVPDGLSGLMSTLESIPEGSAKVDVIRAFEDNEFVFVHASYDFFGPKVGFDVFRFEDGLIVEHWDNLSEPAVTTNPSGRTELDGSTDIVDLDKSEENKALVADFVDSILVNGDYEKLAGFYDGDNYIQHNAFIGDGLSGLATALEDMAKQGITLRYETTHAVMGEGNFVLAISDGYLGDTKTSFYDLFRIDNGKIAEHWDVLEPILPESQAQNTNGKFGKF